MRPRPCFAALLLVAMLTGAGCHRAGVETYQVPKEKDPELPGMATAPAPAAGATNPGGGGMTGNVPTVAGAGLTWTAPVEWNSQPAGAMRKASYSISGPEGRGELSVTAFPGDVGGELANVNRWRGQAGLPPIAEAQLDQTIDRTTVNGLSLTFVDLGDRQSRTRILGAIVPFGGGVWFFKLTGPGALLERVKPHFRQFLQTVKPPPSA